MPRIIGNGGSGPTPGGGGTSPGIPGFDGDPGVDGFDGAPGAPGAAGATGAQGAGAPGFDGDEGPAGQPGPPGPSGATGAQGLVGAPGFDGEAGPDGLPGAPGVAGATGAQGPSGAPGFDGDAGADGLPGAPAPAGYGTVAGFVMFGNAQGIGIGNFYGPWLNYAEDATGTVESLLSVTMPAAGVLTNFRMKYTGGATSTGAATAVLRKNGVNTAMTATVPNGGTSASDTTHSVSVNAGDEIAIISTTSSTPSAQSILWISADFTR